MPKRRMAYRLPEKKYKKVKKRLEEKGLDFEDFLEKTIDLYLEEKIDPKLQTEDWGGWMEE